ncbi:MAG: hypothetical protein ACTSYJ_06315 [Candidatus Thorarchaeota archaeon]
MVEGDDEMDDPRIRKTLTGMEDDLVELNRLLTETRASLLRLAEIAGELNALERHVRYLLEESECQKE